MILKDLMQGPSRRTKNFTGIDSAYEKTLQPEIHITTIDFAIDEAAEQFITELRMRGIITK